MHGSYRQCLSENMEKVMRHLNNFIDHGSYTTDTISGLDWLDVTTTMEQSVDYISSQFGVGGEYEGWRYATGIEFNQLVNNYTDSSNDTNFYDLIVHDEGKIDGLVILLGSTLDVQWVKGWGVTWDAHFGYPEGEGADGVFGLLADKVPSGPYIGTIHAAQLLDSDAYPHSKDTSRAHYGLTWGSNQAGTIFGSYLVRNSENAIPFCDEL